MWQMDTKWGDTKGDPEGSLGEGRGPKGHFLVSQFYADQGLRRKTPFTAAETVSSGKTVTMSPCLCPQSSAQGPDWVELPWIQSSAFFFCLLLPFSLFFISNPAFIPMTFLYHHFSFYKKRNTTITNILIGSGLWTLSLLSNKGRKCPLTSWAWSKDSVRWL